MLCLNKICVSIQFFKQQKMDKKALKSFSVVAMFEKGLQVFFSVPTSYTIFGYYSSDENAAEFGANDLCYFPIDCSEPADKRKWSKIFEKGKPIEDWALMHEYRVKIRQSGFKTYAKVIFILIIFGNL